MKILNYSFLLILGLITMIGFACNDESDNSNNSSNEDSNLFRDGEPTLIEGNLPDQTVFYVLNTAEEKLPLEPTAEKFSIIENEQKGFYSFIYESFGTEKVKFIQQFKENEKGKSFELITKEGDAIFIWELKKTNEPGRWTLKMVDDSGIHELADKTWVKKWAENNNYIKIEDVLNKAKTGYDIISLYIKDEMKWKEVVEYKGNMVLLTECDIDPAELEFTDDEYSSEDYVKINKTKQGEELTIQKVLSEDYWICLFCQDGEHMGGGNSAEIMISFKHYSVKISETEFSWEELIFKKSSDKERVFVPYDALDRYPPGRIPCKGENENFPELDKILNQKWIQVAEDDHNKVTDSEVMVLAKKKDGFYYFNERKVCSFDEGIYFVDCDETMGCFYLILSGNILQYVSRPWCANENDSETTFYKKVK